MQAAISIENAMRNIDMPGVDNVKTVAKSQRSIDIPSLPTIIRGVNAVMLR